jgi:hypothetical protein
VRIVRHFFTAVWTYHRAKRVPSADERRASGVLARFHHGIFGRYNCIQQIGRRASTESGNGPENQEPRLIREVIELSFHYFGCHSITHHASAVHSCLHWIRGMQLIRWHDTATDESTECPNAFVIVPSAVTILFRISIFIYDHSIATLSVSVDSVGLGDRRGCDECKELLESEQWLAL